MSELGNRVRAARAYAGEMSQKELAGRLPFSLSTLQRIEAGGRALRALEEPAFVEAVAEATGLPPWFFTANLERIGPREPTTEDDVLGRLERRLDSVQEDLRSFHRDTRREIDKQGRSAAHDRGRLGRMERDVAKLAELMLELVEKPDAKQRRERRKK